MDPVMAPSRKLWTIGHSNHEPEYFAALLQDHAIEFVIDVRSYPYSRFAHFNRETLKPWLETRGVRYVFMGDDLGGRPVHDDQYDAEGHAIYSLMAEESGFRRAIDRLERGLEQHRLAIMCSCGQPAEVIGDCW